jgi:peptidoglycan/LPS O-acetylase OafA/YrhL
MHELLHPPAHRGPLIAAGAVVLTVGVALEQVRITPGAGVQFLVVAALAVVLLWLALQERYDGGPPHAHVTVLIVCGLLAAGGALVRFADVLVDVDDGVGSGTIVWVALLETGLAAYASARRRSAVASLIAAISLAVAVLSAWDWIFDADSVTPYRWLLLLLALVFVLASLPLRGTSQRHSEQMVNAAGLAILAIPLTAILRGLFGTPALPGFWELVVLVGGCALVASASADRSPGPAYLGVANLVAFIVVTSGGDRTLEWWPAFLILVGLIVMAIGLRPRVPLPPEPQASTRPDDQPATVRVFRD